MNQHEVAFRSAFWPSFLALSLLTAIFAVPGAAILMMLPSTGETLSDLIWPLLFAIACWLFAMVFLVYNYPVYVSADGVRSYNLWGIYNTMPWNEMKTTSRYSVIWLHYIVVKNDKMTIHIPLFLSRQQRFVEMVNGFAGPENALVRALASR